MSCSSGARVQPSRRSHGLMHESPPAHLQFGKDIREGKYDYSAEGKQQLLLPSEYKKAVAAKSPAPVISWHPHVIAACWKVACRLISKLDGEKNVSRDCMDWVDTELAAHGTVRNSMLPCCHESGCHVCGSPFNAAPTHLIH